METKIKSFKTVLAESSLSRIVTHVNKTDLFGVMSPFRNENSDEENKAAYVELKKRVREMGYGFIEMRGGYQEEAGFINESSLFIPKISRKEMIALGTEYGQHSIIHKDKDNFAMIGTNKNAGIGKVLDKFIVGGKSISVDDTGEIFNDFFSKLLKGSHRGKKFLFKMEEKVETSMYHAKKHGPNWVQVL